MACAIEFLDDRQMDSNLNFIAYSLFKLGKVIPYLVLICEME